MTTHSIKEAAVTVTLPDDVLRAPRISEAELRQEIGVLLFQQDRVTLAQAARLAGMDRLRFQHLPASRAIPGHYGIADFDDDLTTLRHLGRP